MDLGRWIKNWNKQLSGIQRHIMGGFLIQWIFIFAVMTSCESDQHESKWLGEDTFTIGQYLETNQKEYSKFYRLLVKGRMLSPLKAYNPHGEGYTLFLPNDSAIDHFIQQSTDYGTFEKMLLDTGFIYTLTRYHTVNRKVHTDEFPDGALNDRTLSGNRLIIGFYTDGNNQLIKVNNVAPIIKSNLEMTNGYVHVISEVLHQVEISGYDWLQQQDDYSILAQAMELSGIRGKLKWNKYTLLAEHDSVFHRIGINKIEDLINRLSTPGVPISSSSNAFYLFTAYHILSGEFYLNDFYWGENKYPTLANKLITVNVGQEIRINPGVDIFGISISNSGDTTVTDYILPVWNVSNILTQTGPVHSISKVLFYEPFPK
jgi:uncharacterized surface protein with fasciclin (FAS1) repeats